MSVDMDTEGKRGTEAVPESGVQVNKLELGSYYSPEFKRVLAAIYASPPDNDASPIVQMPTVCQLDDYTEEAD